MLACNSSVNDPVREYYTLQQFFHFIAGAELSGDAFALKLHAIVRNELYDGKYVKFSFGTLKKISLHNVHVHCLFVRSTIFYIYVEGARLHIICEHVEYETCHCF